MLGLQKGHKTLTSMRKIILSLVLLLSMSFATNASAFSFDWGVTGGLNYTKMNLKGDYKDYFKSDNRAGWFAGVKANVGIVLGFGLDGAIVYSQQKYNLVGTQVESAAVNESQTARSIEVPINLKYSIGLGKMAAIYVATGPQFGFNLGDKTLYSVTQGTFERENMTTSWNVGVGAKLLGHLDLGVGYNFGLGKVGDAIANETIGNQIGAGKIFKTSDTKANTFQVQLTYYF